ncbi:glycoside hydrolase family 16 protein [Paenibacillus sp. LHD-38]|uniref:glycoside hydrolase family 16 protein n=1 Tax=Paenibacillus sp. LHD-38 TaxID=3072143 RepID=UPI00280D5E54|nr:glycoside hydrolase family 16 protein [Paenibacillus sp. LHD-38]MDQ8738007.1 glycoside hydrolase family 16 protein [Paenibacillus sp. LHD-38]
MEKWIGKKWLGAAACVLSITIMVGYAGAASNVAALGGAEAERVMKEEIMVKKEAKEKRMREKREIQEMKKAGWNITFLDNFEGELLDPTKWDHAPEWQRKDGYWSDEEAFLDGKGNLIIQVSERDGKYYSGAVTTSGIFEQAYGYYEMRAKIPKVEGFWTAFWLMTDGAHTVGNEGKDGTEIDIVETPFAYMDNDTVVHAMHWDGYEADHKSAAAYPVVPGIYEGFHTFALEWNKDEYIYYIDGNETWRSSAGGVSEVPAFVQITAEVGKWGGNIGNAVLPAQMVVDYVRVYESKENKQ